MLEVYRPSLSLVIGDMVRALPLAAWVLFVVHYLSRWSYQWASSKWGRGVGLYFARKVIHMAAGGLVALMIPLLFREPIVPFLLGMGFALYTYLPHRRGKLFNWFQDPDNISEVYYCITWGLATLIAWPFNVWLAVYPLFLMSFGDGITGIIRGIRQRRRVKSWDGSLGFLAVSAPIGYLLFGPIGVAVAVIAMLFEKAGIVDDNISVPLVSLALLLIGYQLGAIPSV